METEYVTLPHVEMQCMIESAFHVFQETTMYHRIEAIGKSKVVNLLKNDNQEAGKGKRIPVYQAVVKIVLQFVARGAVNEVIRMQFDNLADLEYFAKHLTLNFIKNLSCTVPSTH